MGERKNTLHPENVIGIRYIPKKYCPLARAKECG
jgi:hypothetical protein